MRNILKTPQIILDDCPGHPKLATISYWLFLIDFALLTTCYVVLFTGQPDNIMLPVLISTITFLIATLAVSIPATFHHRYK